MPLTLSLLTSVLIAQLFSLYRMDSLDKHSVSDKTKLTDATNYPTLKDWYFFVLFVVRGYLVGALKCERSSGSREGGSK